MSYALDAAITLDIGPCLPSQEGPQVVDGVVAAVPDHLCQDPVLVVVEDSLGELGLVRVDTEPLRQILISLFAIILDPHFTNKHIVQR